MMIMIMTERMKLDRMKLEEGPALETRWQTERETKYMEKDEGEYYVFIHFKSCLNGRWFVWLAYK